MRIFTEKEKQIVESTSNEALDNFIQLTETQSFWQIYEEVSILDCMRNPKVPDDMIRTLLFLYTAAILRINKLKTPLQ